MLRATLLAVLLLATASIDAGAAPRDLGHDAVNAAVFAPPDATAEGPDPVLLKAQVLLGRAGFSPGEIDGRDGESTRKAIADYAAAHALTSEGDLTPEIFAALTADTAPVLDVYTLTAEDLDQEFQPNIPDRLEELADLDRLAYRNVREMLAERFHMSERLVEALNPGRALDRAGTEIVVAAVTPFRPELKPDPAEAGRVATIRIYKAERRLVALDKSGGVVAVYPASIGSEEKPAPSGNARINAVARNPTYHYDPKFAFKDVRTKEKFTVKGGPNNPVGAVWIDLDIPSYGIHGTPEPSRVGKTFSHGCIRLTNWDVSELAARVDKQTRVEFID